MITCFCNFTTRCRKVMEMISDEMPPTIEAKGMSDKDLPGKGCGNPLAMMLFCDNDTSGKNPVLKDGEIPMRANPMAACRITIRRRSRERMEKNELLRYSMQLSMLKQLRKKQLLSEKEYILIEKKLMKDYGIVSNITT